MRTRWFVLGGVGLLLVAGVATGVVWVRRDRSAAVPATVVLAAASDPGSDPFVPVAASRPVPVTLPPAGTGGAVTASVDEDSGVRSVAGTTDRLYAGLAGDSDELYGGSGSLSACDPAAIAEFLAAHPDKAAAWAGVQGIDPAGIADYLDTLTPVVMLHDTVVTNHGFANGVAVPVVSVLQAGTAVLVDVTGLPVVRCACGNPLSAPPTVDLSTAVPQGTRWDGFDQDRTIVVTAGAAASSLMLVDVDTGQDLTVNIGSMTAPTPTSVEAPTTSSSANPPPTPTTATPADTLACALDLTWPESTSGWIAPLQGALTCQQMINQWRRYEQWIGEREGSTQRVEFGDGWVCSNAHAHPDIPDAVGGCALGTSRFVVQERRAGGAVSTPAASLSTSSAAAVEGVTDTLITPSQNIDCARKDGQFACTIKEFDFDLGDERCPGARGPIVRLDANGSYHPSSCRGDFFDGISWPEPTPYGTSEQFGDITCDVEQTGLTCTNDEGHGFALSRSGIKPF